MRSRPRMILPVQSLVCLAAFGLALPLAISLFPQMSEVSTCLVPAKASFALWIMVSRLQITFGEVGCCLFHLTSHCPGGGCVGPSCWRMLQHRLTARGSAPNSTSGWVVWWDVLSKRNPHSTQQNPHSTHLSKTRGSNVCSSFPSHLLYPSTVICFSCTEDIWTAKRSKHQGAVGQAGWSILGSV